MEGKLDGRVAFVTGAGSGMGRAIALEFARNGARIVAVDINEGAVRQTAEMLGGSGQAFAYALDVSSAAAVEAICRSALAAAGTVDILVNCAGIHDAYNPVLETDEALWDRVIDVNLKGMYLTARALLPGMLAQRKGVIINISSIAGMVAGGGGAAYTSSKHGVIGLTRQIAFDYGQKGVRANVICPGAVETGMTREIFASESLAVMETVRSVPAGRHAQADEIASMALYLASDEASFVHGAVFTIDGGWTVR